MAPPVSETATLPHRRSPHPGVERGPLALTRDAGPVLAGWVLPFALVLYLAFQGGGYDLIIRSEIGIAAWWVLLAGAAVGVLPSARIGRSGWIFLGLLCVFAAWTALGIGWSESAERSAAELGRVATLMGIFTLALFAQGEGALRRTAGAIATAVAVIGGLALLSRFQPEWFGTNATLEFLPSTQARLNYPVDYWNGLAALMAIGLPLLLWAATAARSMLLRTLALGAVPAIALAAYLTLSRGGAAEVGVALTVLFLLHPARLRLLGPAVLGAAGSAILIAAVNQREALESNLGNGAAQSQGETMLAMTLVVCAGVALTGTALTLAARGGLLPRPRISRTAALRGTAVAAVAAIGLALALGVPGEVSDAWNEFKQPVGPGESTERLESASGNGRWQWWGAAVDAGRSEPLLGIGPGTFEFWWAREGDLPGFVRDAHSLYLETLAELGIVGFALIVALVGGAVALAARRALDRSDQQLSMLSAAVAAALAAFATAAAVDWAWELTILPVVFLLLLAGLLGGSRQRGEGERPRFGATKRVAVAGVSLAALVAIVLPMAGTAAVRESQAQAAAGADSAALAEASQAADVQPYAASPELQRALVLELRGELTAAAAAAAEATREEPTNWRTWLVRSRIEAERGNPEAALAAYREARDLNPRSPLFNR